MAVVDKYVDTESEANRLGSAHAGTGGGYKAFAGNFEVAAADDDTSTYRIAKGVSPTDIPHQLLIGNDAITGGTDYDVGIALQDSTTLLFSLGTTLNLSSAHAIGSELDGLENLGQAQIGKMLHELIATVSGYTSWTKPEAWKPIDLVIQAPTVGTAAGTICYRGGFIQGS